MGIINLEKWDIYFVGKDLPENISFSNGYRPKTVIDLNYTEYAEFMRSIDLGFSLMYTPHPSYPPLDLAACGAAVVTNQYASKKDLSCYSENILCVDSSIDGLLEGIRKGVELATDFEKRKTNYDNHKISRDWRKSFDEIIQNIGL